MRTRSGALVGLRSAWRWASDSVRLGLRQGLGILDERWYGFYQDMLCRLDADLAAPSLLERQTESEWEATQWDSLVRRLRAEGFGNETSSL